MPEINIEVRNKIVEKTDDMIYVCNNSDYIASFDFDSEWDAYNTKTARFSHDGQHVDVVFTGNQCNVPVITNTYAFHVGVFAGDLHTTTAARVPCRKSILCGAGAPANPTPDVYDQLMELIKGLGGADPDAIAKAVADYLAAHPIEETDPTVPEWAKADTKPTYTAAEVGAISQSDLQASTDAALAQAKSSGEFDGAPGPVGPQGPAGAPGKDGAGMDITGASAGQIAKIAAVDASGVPTAWSPVDMPSGGGASEVSWHEWDNVIVPEGGLNAFDFTTLKSGEKLSDHQVKGMFIYSPSATSSADTTEQSALLIVNGDYMFDLASFVRNNAGYLRLLLTVENGMLVVRYYKRDTDACATFVATKVAINNQGLRYPSAISKDAVSVIGYGKTLKTFNQIQSVRIESNGQVAKSVEFDVQVLY